MLRSVSFCLLKYYGIILANAYRTYYGDVMVIHATQDIKKGDEIYLVYVDPLLGFSERKKKLNDWKFTCDCKLCEIDSKDPYCLKRDEMLVEFIEFEKVAFISPKNVIAKAALAEMLFALSIPYHRVGNIAKCIQYLEEVLTLMDNTPLKHAIRIQDICVNLADCYSSMGKMTKFEQMIKKAMELTFCNDLDHFKLLYPEISHL
uniref:SET domain-containing protein n=1 Tax=Panagrolaimus davidi TaxID=227884 RepID=A0A914PLT3_9BILA